jgi:Tfp pilus assembly protein PilN
MINLLPTQYKRELKKEEKFKLVLILGTLFLIFLISLILILFSIKIYIQGQAETLKFLAREEEEKLQRAEIRELRQKITAAQKTILQLRNFYQNRSDPVRIVESIFQILPEQIHLTSFSFNKDTGMVLLSGFSPGREILFQLRTNLEDQEEFGEINFPPQNWIKSKDIDFQVTFKVNR